MYTFFAIGLTLFMVSEAFSGGYNKNKTHNK